MLEVIRFLNENWVFALIFGAFILGVLDSVGTWFRPLCARPCARCANGTTNDETDESR